MNRIPLRLLIIDDSDDDALILTRQLRTAGYNTQVRRVQTAAGLDQALQDQVWDLAVCDYRMPGFGGAAALDQVKSQKPELPFIFVSGTLPPDSKDLIGRADGFVAKDNPHRLLEVLKNHLPKAQDVQNAEPPGGSARRGFDPATVPELESFFRKGIHDLRAPLRAMHSWTQAALEMNSAAELDPEVRDALGRVLRAAERQEALLRGLENFAKVTFSPLSPEPADLDLAAERALSSLRASLDRSGAKVMTEDPLGKVRADPNLLAEVLICLISNAAKFTAPDRTASITVRSEARGPLRRLWIEDQGIGIAPADQSLLFRPFERLHGVDEYAGSGLGLVIADRAARRMEGSIGVESAPDKGSRFWLDLPVA